MLRFKWPSIILITLFLLSCNNEVPTLDGIDQQAWKGDRNGCKKVRQGMVESMKAERKKLLSLDEIQVVKMLGRPDRNELFKRNQKFYYYFLEPSEECKDSAAADALKLIIRFNAMGLAKEVLIE
jgi:hypothetical protein